MKIDCHVHTKFCGHAIGNADEYIQSAKTAGIDAITFTDHAPLWYLPSDYSHQELAKPFECLEEYVNHVRMAQWWYEPYPAALGLEVDYIPNCLPQISKTVGYYDFDYIIGSVHFIGKQLLYDIDAFGQRQSADIWDEYLDLTASGAESGQFDALAHIDVLKHYVPKPPNINLLFEKIADRISKAGICVEVNTSGLRSKFGDLIPSLDWLAICLKKNIDITIGSDTHDPKDVGSGIDTALKTAKDLGYTKVAIYKNRRKYYIDLP